MYPVVLVLFGNVYMTSLLMDKHLTHFVAITNGGCEMKIISPKTLDDLDKQIVALLQGDSRLSFNKLAKKLGVSVGTAYNRVKTLEALGVVKGYTVVLDSSKLGFELTAIILIQAAGKHLLDVEKEIANTANVIAVYDIAGEHDAAVVAKFKDRTSLNKYLQSLLAKPYVKRTVTNVALNVVKEDLQVRFNSV
jgi:Lrp/AsnC family transcriptional regulator for asnA, asnC and gidA